MKLPTTVLLLVAGMALLSSCNKFEYDGDEFPPTGSVVVYGENDKIDRPYTVIGHLSGVKGTFSSLEGLKKAMAKQAAKRGADGIAFMAETSSKSPQGGRQIYKSGGVAGPMETPGFTRTEKGIWALLVKFK